MHISNQQAKKVSFFHILQNAVVEAHEVHNPTVKFHRVVSSANLSLVDLFSGEGLFSALPVAGGISNKRNL